MKVKRYVLALFVLLFLVGCAAQQPLTREDIMNLRAEVDLYRTAKYEKTPEEILLAAERVLISSDEKYKPGEQTPSTAMFSRRWTLYVIFGAAIGSDHWKIETEEVSDGTLVSVTYWPGQTFIGIIPVLTDEGGSETNYCIYPETYSFFFERLEYMLGIREVWSECSTAQNNLDRHKKRKLPMYSGTWRSETPLFPLCSHTNTVYLPEDKWADQNSL